MYGGDPLYLPVEERLKRLYIYGEIDLEEFEQRIGRHLNRGHEPPSPRKVEWLE